MWNTSHKMCVGMNVTQILCTWVSFLGGYIASPSCVDGQGDIKLAHIRLWWRTKYPDPLIQTIILGLICFCIPGMFNALNGLGAAGKADATTTDNANTALAVTFAVCSILAGVRIFWCSFHWGGRIVWNQCELQVTLKQHRVQYWIGGSSKIVVWLWVFRASSTWLGIVLYLFWAGQLTFCTLDPTSHTIPSSSSLPVPF